MSEVNLDRLRELGGHVRDSVRQLRELGQSPREVFLADARSVNSAKYLLIVATEAALDICNHLAARRGARSPEDYADCMAIMAEIGVIDDDLKARMMRMARFRNLLVHLYAGWTTARYIGSSARAWATWNTTSRAWDGT